jgi:hypothetical protein
MIYQINASSDAFFCAQTVPKLQLSRTARKEGRLDFARYV